MPVTEGSTASALPPQAVATTGKGIDSPAELLAAASNALDQAKPTKDPKIAV